MGEISRTIGIAGENITIENFCKLIGWRGTKNLEFPCKNRKKHDNRRTHDIDFFATYNCPLIFDTQECVSVSVKYTQVPSNIKETFKSFCEAIAKSAECFKVDEKYRQILSGSRNSNINNTQVIFWLNHSEDNNKDLVREVGNISAEIGQDFDTIYLVDNFRLSFIYSSITFAKQLYPSDKDEITFYYPITGINEYNQKGRDESGFVLPVQFINSPIIPIRIIDEYKRKILYLTIRENFEEDAFKRIVGLAQALTSGWCNKIIICFPDYQEIKHSYTKDAILVSFGQPKFTDMIEVKCYQNSFKSFEVNNFVDYSEPLEREPEFNIETMLPYGDRLRQLLTQSKVGKSEIQTILTRRGIYVPNKLDKEALIPILTTSLISPSEFEYIRRRHSAKEVAEKVTMQSIIVEKGTSTQDILAIATVSISDAVKKANPNNEVGSISNFVLKNNGDIEADCEYKRPFLTKDWATINPTQKLKIVISNPKKYDNQTDKVNIAIISTSNEAKTIGKDIVKDISTSMKESGIVRRDAFLQKTLASDFTNEQRTDLLLSFLSITEKDTKIFSFFGVTDLEFAISDDNSQNIPDDIASLKDKVKQSVFSGVNLQEIKYIKDRNYRTFFLFEVITAEYTFTLPQIEGKIQVEFGFPDLKSKLPDKAEFEFKINDIHPYVHKNLTGKEYQELGSTLQDEFNRLKSKKINTSQRKYGIQGKLIE